jgi:RNA polymerase-binding transcription factor DksA
METETGTDIAAGAGAEDRPPTQFGTVADGTAPVSPAPVEPADVDAVEGVLDQVDGALTRLDDGSYGRCETCGAIIADERLAETPTATTCATCPVLVAG